MVTTAAAGQAERRRRILDAAADLASEGGYDAVQMRAVAQRGRVALGTLYRHFPSKIHLLVAVLARELDRVQDRADRAILRGATPYDRLMVVLGNLTRSLQRDPKLTEATARALVFADASAAAPVNAISRLIDTMFAHALSNAEPTTEQLAVAHVITDVWLANLLAWVTGRAGADEVAARLELTTGLLLGRRAAADVF